MRNNIGKGAKTGTTNTSTVWYVGTLPANPILFLIPET